MTVDFRPVIVEKDGKTRKPKKGEAVKLVERGKYELWSEPLSWFLLEHVKFRDVLRWYAWEWWDASRLSWSLFRIRQAFRVRVETWMVPCEVGQHHVMPEKIAALEERAWWWRAVALCALSLLFVVLATLTALSA